MAADHVEPLVIAHPTARPSRIDVVLLEPFVYIVKEILLAPQHSGQRLPHHIGGIVTGAGRGYRPVELVSLAPAGPRRFARSWRRTVLRWRVWRCSAAAE
jgi:hypothetical protein